MGIAVRSRRSKRSTAALRSKIEGSEFVSAWPDELIAVKSMDREVVQVDGTYALREASEAHGEFASENEALMVKNTILAEK
jgi:hypothetical protein